MSIEQEHDQDHDDVRQTRSDLLRTAAGSAFLLSGAPRIEGLMSALDERVAAATPRRGGELRVGLTGGSAADTLDAGLPTANYPDTLRVMALYNGLVRLSVDAREVVYDLAEEISSSKDAKTWTVRLKDGVTFHNGKPVTAADVIYTLRRIGNPKKPLAGASSIAPLELTSMKAVDKRTVRLHMKTPYATFLDQISGYYFFGIVPVGYDPRRPIGTGPFKFQSFTPGQQSVFTRNENYFRHGRPYVEKLTIIDSFATPTATFNALQGGQIDVQPQAPFAQVRQAQRAGLKVVESRPGLWTPVTMRVDAKPFDDVRVRQAFRLMVDRQQMIDQSLNGYGIVGNDVFSLWDKNRDTSLTRDQDVDRAKALLKAAGHENLTVELVTADIAAGVVEAAQVFAQQAKAAGADVKVRKVPAGTFFGSNYLKWPLAQDFWGYAPYFTQIAQATLPTSPYSETHWNDPHYIKLYEQANRTTNAKLKREIAHELQRIDFQRGGYIIYAFNKLVTFTSQKVSGIARSGAGIDPAYSWETVWLS